jgi:hypothetical protein
LRRSADAAMTLARDPQSGLVSCDWAGPFDFEFKWWAAATTNSTTWCAQVVCVAHGATDDPTFPAQALSNCVSDLAAGTTLQTNDALLSGVTASCSPGDTAHIKFSRDTDETSTLSDSMSGDARLLGVEMTVQRHL